MRRPLVHCLTNAATAPFVADCVAAVGGRPVMAEDPQECAHLAEIAEGLCINLGQLTQSKQEAILASLEARGNRPWVLDPVGVGSMPERLSFARHLLSFQPTIIRGNASEIYALATGQASGSGIDSTLNMPLDWRAMTQDLPAQEICPTQVLRSGVRQDLSLKDGEMAWVKPGVPTMSALPGFGCALSAVAATLGSGQGALELFGQTGRAISDLDLGAFRAAFVGRLAWQARQRRIRQALPLYFVAGPQDCADLASVLAAALAGGITAFQYRPKGQDLEQVRVLGRELRVQCRTAGIPFIANDSISLAQVLDADGVHLGQDDGNVAQARRMLGPDALIGLSVSKPEHWQVYEAMAVDYVGLGPFATTATKPDARQPLGVEGTRALRQGWDGVPAVSIGGISLDQAPAALRTGVQGIAVVSAIAGAPDPKTAAQKLAALIQS